MRPLCLFLCLVGASLAGRVTAAPHWVEVSVDLEHVSVQIDTASVKTLDDGRIQAAWRRWIPKANDYDIEEGSVNCEEESIRLNKSETFRMDPKKQRPDVRFWATDYVAGKYLVGVNATDLRPQDVLKRNQYPIPFLYYASPLVYLCGDRYASMDQRQPAVSEVRTWLDCEGSPLKATKICGADLSNTAFLADLSLRFRQAVRACGLDDKQAADIRSSWRLEMTDCADNPDCPSNIAQSHVSGTSQDLSRAAEGRACEFLPKAVAAAPEKVERLQATARFDACKREKYAVLEDGSSSPIKLARAILKACDDQLAPSLKNNRDFMRLTPQALAGEIGEWRAAKSK